MNPQKRLEMMIKWEERELTQMEEIELFQHLIDIRLVWQLQGTYGRQASYLIETGYCEED